jgi:hypothetical protein
MGWQEDVGKVLVDAGVGIVNTNIFYSTKAGVPTGVGPYLSVVETGGAGHDNTHGDAAPSYIFPGAMITIRGANPVAVKTMAMAAYVALAKIKNQVINGVWYRRIQPTQLPGDYGLDDTSQRIVYSFNILGDRSLT